MYVPCSTRYGSDIKAPGAFSDVQVCYAQLLNSEMLIRIVLVYSLFHHGYDEFST